MSPWLIDPSASCSLVMRRGFCPVLIGTCWPDVIAVCMACTRACTVTVVVAEAGPPALSTTVTGGVHVPAVVYVNGVVSVVVVCSPVPLPSKSHFPELTVVGAATCTPQATGTRTMGAVPRVSVAVTLVIVGGGIARGWSITAPTTTPQG